MKTPDNMNHMPIDNIKYFLNSKILMNYGVENILIYVNPNKIDFEKIDKLDSFQQDNTEISLERIIDDKKFNESKGEDGWIEIKVKLKDISTINKI